MNGGKSAVQPLVFLQLNELNFEYVSYYAERGVLPNFRQLLQNFDLVRTRSESEHHLANPWIQWPTVHTGLSYAEHGIFRLGDSAVSRHPQIYGLLEAAGFRVAAISPFNARNDTSAPCFFVPDPWTPTRFEGPEDLRRLYRALAAFTDSYASHSPPPKAYLDLALGALPNLRLASLPELLSGSLSYLAKREKWWRAVICDVLLTDCFLRHWRHTRPDFATLFLNGAAHLQHHYLFSSRAYKGDRRNPSWHVRSSADPLQDILKSYDRGLGRLLSATKPSRVLIATALHQEPHERETYYYRLDDHAAFLRRIGLQCSDTYRLMTEDFVIRFEDAEAAARAEKQLAAVRSRPGGEVFYVETGDSAHRTTRTGAPLFHIENRGETLYVQLRPTARAIPSGMAVESGNVVIADFDRLVSLAQFKNTHHVGEGYYLDTAFPRGRLPDVIALTDIFDVILDHFGAVASDEARAGRGSPAWLAAAKRESVAA